MTERVTVIIVTDRSSEDQVLLSAIQSVEQQDFDRDLVDTHIVLNMDTLDYVEALRHYGAEKADTEWIVLMEDDHVWPPDMLSRLFAMKAPHQNGSAIIEQRTAGVLWRRSLYLEQGVHS